MDASSTTAALENFLDDFNEENPPFLSCKDCLCTDYTPDPSTQEVTVQIKLCSVHSANLQAPNPSTSPAPPVLNSPDPTRPIAVPTANRTLPAGRRRDDDNQQIVPAVLVVDMHPPSPPGSASTPRPSRSPRPTLNSPRSSSPTRSRSPLRRPIPSTSPPTNRGRRTTSNLPADCLSTYKRVLRKYHDPQNRRKKIEEIYATEKISRRTWHRKRPIAELQILDASQFDELLRKHLTDTTEDRLNQEVFGSACSKILKRPAMIAKRRRAVAAGQLI